jgi:hypothetical protein
VQHRSGERCIDSASKRAPPVARLDIQEPAKPRRRTVVADSHLSIEIAVWILDAIEGWFERG